MKVKRLPCLARACFAEWVTERNQNRPVYLAAVLSIFVSATAAADEPPTLPDTPEGRSPFVRATPPNDPTGGSYTTPTLLFTPAGAVPAWNVRVIASLEAQGPTAPDRLATGRSVGFMPGVGGELGLPGGFTFGAGTNWVGGNASTNPANLDLSPYFQLRYHILGDAVSGRGFQLGTSATYKLVGFQGDPGEGELALSAQYRERYYELGLETVMGKDFATSDSDAELHAYALYRPIPQLGLGGAAQVRYGLVSQSGAAREDVVSGAIASLTLDRWQLAALGGESTINLAQGTTVKVGGLGQVFATARF